jgi:hypothetical protein
MTKQPEALRLANLLDLGGDATRPNHWEAAEELRRLHEISIKYSELLYAVHAAFPDEDRHQTALRYITQTERLRTMCESAKEQA